MGPERVSDKYPPSIQIRRLQTFLLSNIGVGNPPKIFDESHSPSLQSMRLRNALYPDNEQVNDDECRDNDG